MKKPNIEEIKNSIKTTTTICDAISLSFTALKELQEQKKEALLQEKEPLKRLSEETKGINLIVRKKHILKEAMNLYCRTDTLDFTEKRNLAIVEASAILGLPPKEVADLTKAEFIKKMSSTEGVVPLGLLFFEGLHLLQYLLVREPSVYMFYADAGKSTAHTPPLTKVEEFARGIIRGQRVLFYTNLENPYQIKTENKFLLEAMTIEDKISGRKIKDKILDALKTPSKNTLRKVNYYCEGCGIQKKLYMRDISAILQFEQNGQICDECQEKRKREREKVKKAERRAEQINERAITKERKEREERETEERLKNLSPSQMKMRQTILDRDKERSRKKQEKKKFYKDLKIATREVYIAKIRVFGQGRTERIMAKDYSTNSKKWSFVHIENMPEKSEWGDKREKQEEAMRIEAKKECLIFIDSEEGKAMGLTRSSLEEMILATIQEYDIHKKNGITIKEALDKVIS